MKEPAKIGKVSAKTFAKMAGVSLQNVVTSIKSGRIQADVMKRGYAIAPDQLDRMQSTAKHRRTPYDVFAIDDTFPVDDCEMPAEDDNPIINDKNAPIKERVFKARKARLDYYNAKKELVDCKSVEKTWLNLAQGMVGQLLTIPERIAPSLEGLSHVEIRIYLKKEIERALIEISKSIKVVVDEKER